MVVDSLMPEFGRGSAPVTATIAEQASALLGVARVALELYRSRRYCRSFAVIAHPLFSRGDEVSLRDLVRASDHVWVDRGKLYLLAPEADADGARRLVARVAEAAPKLFDADLARIAVFPDDALTSDALLALVSAPRGASAEKEPGDG